MTLHVLQPFWDLFYKDIIEYIMMICNTLE